MKDNCSHLLNKSVMQIVAMLLVFLMLTGCSTNSRSNTITTELKEDGKTALIPIIDEDQAEERSKEAQKYTYEVHASGSTIVMVTHDRELLKYADRVVEM